MESLQPQLNRIQLRAVLVGVIAVGLCVLGAVTFSSTEQFFRSYLVAFLFWFGIALGSLALLALHHLVGGGWGFVIQRLLESSARTLPLMALLFLPLFFGVKDLYIWARPEVVAADALLQHKSLYLNVSFFGVRALAYFAIWTGFALLITKWSLRQDRTSEAGLTRKMQMLSGPILVLYVLTMTFAAFDWGMSLDPHWFSTVYGILFVVGQGLATLAFAIIVFNVLSKHKPLAEVVSPQHFHDLGNLMMAFVMLWAYIAFSQFLIIWSGNLPEEIPWYLNRLQGGWQWLGLFLVLFHFAIPFVLLLSRRTKRTAEILTRVALAMIFMRLVDLFWTLAPSFQPKKLSVHWMDVLVPVGLGGLWVAAFIWQLQKRALLPIHDPRLKEAFEHE